MIVSRISNELYKEDISGNGAAINGSRWNSKGTRLLYTGEYISLVILESLVHLRTIDIPEKQYLLQIELPDVDFSEIKLAKIKDNWQQHLAYTQWMGDQFVSANQSLILKVPSAVIPMEYNYIINTRHPDFQNNVTLVRTEDYFWDERLF